MFNNLFGNRKILEMIDTDRELLEFAAKAAGYVHAADHVNAGWNPLTDSGDAQELAVKLRLQTEPKETHVYIVAENGLVVAEDYDGDPYAATRRAIVRAAAEIGRNMK